MTTTTTSSIVTDEDVPDDIDPENRNMDTPTEVEDVPDDSPGDSASASNSGSVGAATLLVAVAAITITSFCIWSVAYCFYLDDTDKYFRIQIVFYSSITFHKLYN